jgi:hypothetical protein
MSTESEVTLTVERFRADFTEFADEAKHTEPALQNSINRASLFVSRQNSIYFADDNRLLALELMAAHIQTLSLSLGQGNSQGGLVGASSVGSVSVTLIPPPIKRQFDFWMNQTGYGQQYLALMQAHSPAGMFMGGSYQRVFR